MIALLFPIVPLSELRVVTQPRTKTPCQHGNAQLFFPFSPNPQLHLRLPLRSREIRFALIALKYNLPPGKSIHGAYDWQIYLPVSLLASILMFLKPIHCNLSFRDQSWLQTSACCGLAIKVPASYKIAFSSPNTSTTPSINNSDKLTSLSHLC